jgi:hypothetical protein
MHIPRYQGAQLSHRTYIRLQTMLSSSWASDMNENASIYEMAYQHPNFKAWSSPKISENIKYDKKVSLT